MTQQRLKILTGIKPTGSPHLGNYIGAIKPALTHINAGHEAMYFVADYHALTTVRNADDFAQLCHEVAATWLALGLDPDKAFFYRQSEIPETFELMWLLACSTSKGLMNRSHAYKAAVDENVRKKLTPDHGVNMGLYNYPILMAADILILRADIVPVGKDQKQHVEMARDIAIAFNKSYGDILTIPTFQVSEETGVVPGLDGRKMSKTYNNTIPLFSPSEELRKRVFQIKTDSTAPHEPKDPNSSPIYLIYKEFASKEQSASMKERLEQGRLSWAEAKEELFVALDTFLTVPREKYHELMNNPSTIDALLAAGADKVRTRISSLMHDVRKAIGRNV